MELERLFQSPYLHQQYEEVSDFPGTAADAGQCGKNAWDQIMAMSVVAILPCLILFAVAQKTFVEGVSTAGLKG